MLVKLTCVQSLNCDERIEYGLDLESDDFTDVDRLFQLLFNKDVREIHAETDSDVAIDWLYDTILSLGFIFPVERSSFMEHQLCLSEESYAVFTRGFGIGGMIGYVLLPKRTNFP